MSTAEQLGSFGSPPEGTPAELYVVPSDAPEWAFFSLSSGKQPDLNMLRQLVESYPPGDQVCLVLLSEAGLIDSPDRRQQAIKDINEAYSLYRERYFDDYPSGKGFDSKRMEEELYENPLLDGLELTSPVFASLAKLKQSYVEGKIREGLRSVLEADRIARIAALREMGYVFDIVE